MIKDLNNAKKIINKPSHRIAFILGNGINRFAYKDNVDPSWSKLLLDAWDGASFSTKTSIDEGITFTEFYDLLEFESDPKKITQSIIDSIGEWGPTDYHQSLRDALIRLDKPVLTTNFDMYLEGVNMKKLILDHPTFGKGFTYYYPWNVVYSPDSKFSIHNIYNFGIWHINGSINYPLSLKLSLTSYTRQGKRALDYLHVKNYDDDFDGKNQSHWKGLNTWLHLIFNCDLFILGLGLDEQETFLRWLLIERMKYFRRFPDRKRKGWYVGLKTEMTEGKKFFLESIGFELIQLDNYEDIYVNLLDVSKV